jgi:MFS family permease
VVFFFQGMSPGFWVPAITNLLRAEGLGAWVALVFVVPPLCALISPLIGGGLADQRVRAERLFAWSSLGSAVLLALAFGALQAGWHPWWFIGLLGMHSLVGAPQWGLLATISLTHLQDGERRFPLVRLGATIGWVAAGLLTSFVLRADTSPLCGHAGAAARVGSGVFAFLLPATPPLGRRGNWLQLLGLEAFRLLRERDHLVFFGVTAVFSVPLTAFYMYAPEHLRVLGDEHPAATMTLAQWTEIGAMVLMATVLARYRVKTILCWALGLSALRYFLSAVAGWTEWVPWHLAGVALHGVCYTFYFITAQVFLDRRVPEGLRSQAQGLLTLASAGVGPLVGAALCGWLHGLVVTPEGGGWGLFWSLLGGVILLCLVVMLVAYQGLRKPQD